jgi:hypothetical protein
MPIVNDRTTLKNKAPLCHHDKAGLSGLWIRNHFSKFLAFVKDFISQAVILGFCQR